MKRFVKNEKGITLIALIITIIVMLILVAVTITVALNGGIFDKAKDASDKTNLAKEKEILQTTALGYLQKNTGYVDLKAFKDAYSGTNLEGYTITYVDDATYATATNGEQTFYITKQGGITKTEPQDEGTGGGNENAIDSTKYYNITLKNLTQSQLSTICTGLEGDIAYVVIFEKQDESVYSLALGTKDGVFKYLLWTANALASPVQYFYDEDTQKWGEDISSISLENVKFINMDYPETTQLPEDLIDDLINYTLAE